MARKLKTVQLHLPPKSLYCYGQYDNGNGGTEACKAVIHGETREDVLKRATEGDGWKIMPLDKSDKRPGPGIYCPACLAAMEAEKAESAPAGN